MDGQTYSDGIKANGHVSATETVIREILERLAALEKPAKPDKPVKTK